MGTSSINGPFSMDMLNNQMVNLCIFKWRKTSRNPSWAFNLPKMNESHRSDRFRSNWLPGSLAGQGGAPLISMYRRQSQFCFGSN